MVCDDIQSVKKLLQRYGSEGGILQRMLPIQVDSENDLKPAAIASRYPNRLPQSLQHIVIRVEKTLCDLEANAANVNK
jgi:hypothetical protein